MGQQQRLGDASQLDTAQGMATIVELFRLPRVPVPETSLRLLKEAALQDTGGGHVARAFLFWLAGESDPGGLREVGGLELRRLDHHVRSAAVEVFSWWSGPTESDSPLYRILAELRSRQASPGVKQSPKAGE